MYQYKIILRKSAVKELSKLPIKTNNGVVLSIKALARNLRPSRLNKLKGVYVIDDMVLEVDIRKVGNRKDVYE